MRNCKINIISIIERLKTTQVQGVFAYDYSNVPTATKGQSGHIIFSKGVGNTYALSNARVVVYTGLPLGR